MFLKKYAIRKYIKFRLLLLIFLLIIILPILSGCEFLIFKSEPERTVFSFFNDLNLKDVERTYNKYLLNNDKLKIDKEDFNLLISKSLSSVRKIELKRTDLLKRNDEKAAVSANFIITYVDDREEIRTEEIFLIYEDGKWKINFEETFLSLKPQP